MYIVFSWVINIYYNTILPFLLKITLDSLWEINIYTTLIYFDVNLKDYFSFFATLHSLLRKKEDTTHRIQSVVHKNVSFSCFSDFGESYSCSHDYCSIFTCCEQPTDLSWIMRRHSKLWCPLQVHRLWERDMLHSLTCIFQVLLLLRWWTIFFTKSFLHI